MNGIMFDFFQEIGYEMAMFWGNEFIKLLGISLHIENELGRYVLSPKVFQNVSLLVYGVGTGLLLLKTLHKGIKIYLLNRDGDSDVSPIELLKGYALAIITALAFPILYTYLSDFTLWFASQVSSVIGGTAAENFSFGSFLEGATNLTDIIMYLIFIVFLIIFYFDFIKRGIELMILRIGMPFACLGLIDSDNGCFKPYVQQIFKCALTGVVQIFCIEIAIAIVVSPTSIYIVESIIFAISFLAMAKATPALLNQFLIPSQSGGGMQKVSSIVMTANAVRGMFK